MNKDQSYLMNGREEIAQDECNKQKNIHPLELKLEPQLVDYDTAQSILPEKWEMPRNGKLLYDDAEVQQVLKLLVYQLGVEKSLDTIPRHLIEQYLSNSRSTSQPDEKVEVAVEDVANFEDASDFFNEVLAVAEKKISKPSFETWLAHLTAYKEKDTDTWVVVAKNEFQRDWVEVRYSSFIKEIVKELTGRNYSLKFVTNP
ncbi:DnaA N-terminal domain-containing protein [Alkalihalobacterium sp. APHAB7]|uniref:DnaA N-terminal domain-containing protein n=1 Tax=Alkalihalobacterium sp. APHAB7 TaxID=3402081 RepID=UPI003AB0ADE5